MTCPAPLPGFAPRWLISPSALRSDADCPRLHGYGYLEGRRTPDVAYADMPKPPPKAAPGVSAAEKARAIAALKAYNRAMRPALGTATHAVFEAHYLQKVKGAWHPPMAWLDLAEAWHTRPGQIALQGLERMPAPASLAEVWCEVLVRLKPVPGWGPSRPWPRLGGTPDLVTRGRGPVPAHLHLYDYKTTLSFDWAKTAEYLRDADEQSAIYALAVMQEHNLESLDCTWLYLRTEGAPASLPVHFTLTRAHAEARVLALAERAAELEAITEAYVAAGSGFLSDGKRLAIINALPTNDSACANYGGCVYHRAKGGPCTPKRSGLGTALRADGKQAQQKQLRREAVKKERTHMLDATQAARLATLEGKANRNFPENQEVKKLKALAAQGGEAATPADVEATGTDAGSGEATEAADAKPVQTPSTAGKPKAAKAPAVEGGIIAVVDGHSFAVPAGSALGKALVKASKALQAAAAAFEGE